MNAFRTHLPGKKQIREQPSHNPIFSFMCRTNCRSDCESCWTVCLPVCGTVRTPCHNTPVANDLINVAQTKPRQQTWARNSGHIFWAALSPGCSWSPAPLLLLLLVLVLHSSVYWHFVMCCKWQPRHMDNGTRGQCPVCIWLVPLQHAGSLFHFEAFGKLLTSLGHPILTHCKLVRPTLPPLQSEKHAAGYLETIAIDSNCIWNWNSKSLDRATYPVRLASELD